MKKYFVTLTRVYSMVLILLLGLFAPSLSSAEPTLEAQVLVCTSQGWAYIRVDDFNETTNEPTASTAHLDHCLLCKLNDEDVVDVALSVNPPHSLRSVAMASPRQQDVTWRARPTRVSAARAPPSNLTI